MNDILRDKALCTLLPPELWLIILQYRRNWYDKIRNEFNAVYSRPVKYTCYSKDLIAVQDRYPNIAVHGQHLKIFVDSENNIHYALCYWRRKPGFHYVSFYYHGENIGDSVFKNSDYCY